MEMNYVSIHVCRASRSTLESHRSNNNFYHRIWDRQYKNKINSTPDIGVSCEQGAAAATVAAEHDKLTQLQEMGETNDEAAENRRIRYQNLYFEYFNGEAHEMIPARENGLYPPCGGIRESQ